MKPLINLTITLLLPIFALAGVSGGGGGPRPGMNVFSMGVNGSGTGPRPDVTSLLVGDRQGGGGWMSTNSPSAGGSGGGTGPRPEELIIASEDTVDFVKLMGRDSSGKIKFQYKGFEKPQVEVHAINIQEVSEKYLDALKRSQKSQQWEPVDIEGLEN